MHTSTSFPLVTVCHDQSTNQHRGKPYVGKFPGTGALCGHKADCFFHRLLPGGESDLLAE